MLFFLIAYAFVVRVSLAVSQVEAERRRSDVIVVTVVGVSERAATNGNPPRVKVRVEEVLRGAPKRDRSRVIWWGRPLESLGDETPPEDQRQEWERQPLAGPKIGEKWILFGLLDYLRTPSPFCVPYHSRFPFSDDMRKKTVAMIEKYERLDQLARAARETELKPIWEEAKKWRAKVSVQQIKNYFDEADFVAVATLAGMDPMMRFRVEKTLKGRERSMAEILDHGLVVPEYARDRLALRASEKTIRLFQRIGYLDEARYLLFFSERHLTLDLDKPPLYHPIPSGDGVVLADEEALEAVRSAAKQSAPCSPRPVLLVGPWGDPVTSLPYPDYFADAADRSFAVAESPLDEIRPLAVDPKDRDKRVPPGGNALVMLLSERVLFRDDPRTMLRVSAFRLGKGEQQLVLDEHCEPSDEKAIRQLAAEAVRRLLDPKFSLSGK